MRYSGQMSEPSISGTGTAPAAGAARRNALGRSTRDILLVAGERLFAERGVEAVSLREIGAAAGQRNNTAPQYYFGSRTGLLDAIHATRAAALNQRRLELLVEVADPPTTEQLVDVMIRPYAEFVADNRRPYVILLSRLLSERGALENVTSRQAVRDHLAAHDFVESRLVALGSDLPQDAMVRRFHQILAWAIVSFAALGQSDVAVSPAMAERVLADLTPMLSAALTAPGPPR